MTQQSHAPQSYNEGSTTLVYIKTSVSSFNRDPSRTKVNKTTYQDLNYFDIFYNIANLHHYAIGTLVQCYFSVYGIIGWSSIRLDLLALRSYLKCLQSPARSCIWDLYFS